MDYVKAVGTRLRNS